MKSRRIRANTIEEVGILAKAVTVLANHVLQLLLALEFPLPHLVVVVGLCVLQLIEEDLVLVNNPRQAPDTVRAI